MDTNQQNNTNNYQINSFTNGMNSDTAYDQISNTQYLFGKNIRITNNSLLFGDINSNTTEGIISPISAGKKLNVIINDNELDRIKFKSILAVDSIDTTGVVIIKLSTNYWCVYRADLNEDTVVLTKIFKSDVDTKKERFSIVLYNEIIIDSLSEEKKPILKLYIADGEHPLMLININDEEYYSKLTSINQIISNYTWPKQKLKIVNVVSGQLYTQQVQYAYRFYKQYGICSKLSPLTNKINVIDYNRNKEVGNAQNTKTSIGFQLRVDYENKFAAIFDHIQVFRISYIVPENEPQINLISDSIIQEDSNSYDFIDSGQDALAQYTSSEFAALYGVTLIPQTIAHNQGYMFVGGVQDQSSFKIEYDKYNPRSYQFPYSSKTTYYRSTTYDEESKYEIIRDFKRPGGKIDEDQPYITTDIPENVYLNKHVDMSLYDDEYELNDECQYDYKFYFGGFGPNISWRFITCEIPIDGNVNESSINLKEDDKIVSSNLYYGKYSYRTLDRPDIVEDVVSGNTTEWYFKQNGIECDISLEYDNIFTSSLLRSLRRGEVYRYGIVFYDEHGNRSDTLWIADIRTPDINIYPITKIKDGKLYARPIGIEFKVTKPTKEQTGGRNIVAYQIVRCEKSVQYTRNILQCALSRPMRQRQYKQDLYKTPYYPSTYLSTQFQHILYGWDRNDSKSIAEYSKPSNKEAGYKLVTVKSDLGDENHWVDGSGTNAENLSLYQIFSPEVNFRRADTKQKLDNNSIQLLPLYYINRGKKAQSVYAYIQKPDNPNYWETQKPEVGYWEDYGNGRWYCDKDETAYPLWRGAYMIVKSLQHTQKYNKVYNQHIYKDYYKVDNSKCVGRISGDDTVVLKRTSLQINNVSDVKNPLWYQGFSNVQFDSNGNVGSATKQYKNYTSSVGSFIYNNWVSNGMYNLPTCDNESNLQYGYNHSTKVFSDSNDPNVIQENDDDEKNNKVSYKWTGVRGWIGPGPICLLITTDGAQSNHILGNQVRDVSLGNTNTAIPKQAYLGTVLCNIKHTPIQFAGLTAEQKQYDIYYGFGNMQTFQESVSKLCVFDGDIYITPAEFVNMFKAYDFNDWYDSLNSTQIVYYIPMESTVNTFFDYGMNHRNTNSANLSPEPTDIGGIATQERPLHQYNAIYSNNSKSGDTYASQQQNYTSSIFNSRICYSQLKTDGQYIDNWLLYKPADFLDADSKYGQLTNLLSTTNNIYFWQNSAFGKLSVNERSLITDNNDTVLQIGQGGILQRTDYISTKYGMRKDDFCAIDVAGNVYWIDMYNKAIIAHRLSQKVNESASTNNYSELLNVQNIVNAYIDLNCIPTIDYDLQNEELVCKFLKNNNQLVFNTKLNVATSVYTRDYENAIQFNSGLYGIKLIGDTDLQFTKYNHLDNHGDLLNTKLSFVVNSSASQTKIFDVQKIVTMKREYDLQFIDQYLKNKKYTITTDICGTSENIALEGMTDREGNICYPIPRFANEEYGNRIRGKWMKVDIEDNAPNKDYCISHIITKFRQSYS